MSESNGTSPTKILSLDAARSNGIRKGNDFITVQQAYDMVIQECAKVHEFYLQQIPTFTARMVQDALMTYGLIVPQPGTDIAPKTEGSADAEAVGSDASAPAPASDGPDIEPALAVAPVEERPTDTVAPVSGEPTEPAA